MSAESILRMFRSSTAGKLARQGVWIAVRRRTPRWFHPLLPGGSLTVKQAVERRGVQVATGAVAGMHLRGARASLPSVAGVPMWAALGCALALAGLFLFAAGAVLATALAAMWLAA